MDRQLHLRDNASLCTTSEIHPPCLRGAVGLAGEVACEETLSIVSYSFSDISWFAALAPSVSSLLADAAPGEKQLALDS